MSTKTAISIFAASFAEDGRVFRDNALELSGVDQEGLDRIGRTLQTFTRVEAWWWGDYLNELFRRMLSDPKRLTPQLREEAAINPRLLVRLRCRWLDDFCKMTGQVAHTLSGYMALSDFYAPLNRSITLSPWHYQYARIGSCDHLPTAIKWLKRALTESWTCEELYRKVKAALATNPTTEPEHTGLKIAELAALHHWVNVVSGRMDRDELKADDATLILRELEPAENLASRIRSMMQARATA